MTVKNTISQINSKALLTIALISIGSQNIQAAVDCNNAIAKASFLASVDKLNKILDTKKDQFIALAFSSLPPQHAVNINKNLNLKNSLNANFSRAFLAAKNSLRVSKVCVVEGLNSGHADGELISSILAPRVSLVYKAEIDKNLKVVGIQDTRLNFREVFKQDFGKVFQAALTEAIRKNPSLFGSGSITSNGPQGIINGTAITGIKGNGSSPQFSDGSRFTPSKNGQISDNEEDGGTVCDGRGCGWADDPVIDPCASVGDGYTSGSFNGQRVWSSCSGGKTTGSGFGPAPTSTQKPTDESGASGPAPEGFLGGGVKVSPNPTNGLGGDGQGDQNNGSRNTFTPVKPGSGGCQLNNDRSTVGINPNLKPGVDQVGCNPSGISN